MVAVLATLTVLYYATLLLPRDFWEHYVIKEDRIVEMPGTLMLLSASVLFGLGFLHLRRTSGPALLKWATLALAVVFFFGFGEELSWGERLFGFAKAGEHGSFNVQNEINLHNLKFFSGWLEVDRMFQVFWIGFGVLIPIVAHFSGRARGWLQTKVPILPVWTGFLLLFNQFVADIWREAMDGRYASRFPLHYSVFEIKESVISTILAVGTYFWWRELRATERL